uniref:Uncharacterized protein n=1 Tax=Romanomermis culicivorax TaxID=13658 RepID=A0A915HTB9_ROMCU
ADLEDACFLRLTSCTVDNEYAEIYDINLANPFATLEQCATDRCIPGLKSQPIPDGCHDGTNNRARIPCINTMCKKGWTFVKACIRNN